MKKIRWNMKDFIINNLQDLFKIQKNFLLLTIPYHFSIFSPNFPSRKNSFYFAFLLSSQTKGLCKSNYYHWPKSYQVHHFFQRIWCLIFIPDFGPHHNLLLQFKTWCLCQWYTLWIKLGPYFQFVCYYFYFFFFAQQKKVCNNDTKKEFHEEFFWY